jgi:ribosomal protein L37AE/L43A
MHLSPVDPPDCPVCETSGARNTHLPEQLGPWVCPECHTFFTGTTSEFERYSVHRDQRRRLREERG